MPGRPFTVRWSAIQDCSNALALWTFLTLALVGACGVDCGKFGTGGGERSGEPSLGLLGASRPERSTWDRPAAHSQDPT
ncbi:hypothetical protein B0J18DRAFT_88049 [Chaetomium sp. MPI-SDFR-AT-0129]|nr:hypothetical protein B0J18DRAFT_88049 [Chaetomium sp. MPI-SDFR-AT-0129]